MSAVEWQGWHGAGDPPYGGLVASAGRALVELRCESKSAARSRQVQALADEIARAADRVRPADAKVLRGLQLEGGRTVGESMTALSQRVGARLELSRMVVFEGQVVAYLHRRSSHLPPTVGVLLQYEGGDVAIARETAMHVAALQPKYVSRDQVPAEVIARERRTAETIAESLGESQGLQESVDRQFNTFLRVLVLLEQPSLHDDQKTVQHVLDETAMTVTRFARFEVGRSQGG